jgi:hypothetical protein
MLKKLTPRVQNGGAVELKGIALIEVALLIEMVVDRGVDGDNFCKVRICLKRSMARSLRLNGWCEFSARLLSERPDSCLTTLPISFIAAP